MSATRKTKIGGRKTQINGRKPVKQTHKRCTGLRQGEDETATGAK